MPRLPRLWALLVLTGLFASFGGMAPPARAQKKLGTDDTAGRLPAEGADKLVKEYNVRATGFRNLAKGEPTAGKGDAELLDLAAKYHVYRLTWRELTKDPGGAQKVIQQLDLVFADALRIRPKSNEFLALFSRALLTRIKELLSHDDLLVRVNAAMLLPIVARAGNRELADLLAEVLRDEGQSEAVRYWTLPALRELFGMARTKPAGVDPINLSQDQEQRCITALIEYLQRPPEFPDRIVRIQQALADEKKRDAVPDDEKKELAQYEVGHQLSRRAAVRALGETRYPALMKKGEGKMVPDEKGLTALALVRVVANDARGLTAVSKKAKGIPPRASLGEQVEAAIGIGQLQSALTADYCPDYAALHIGNFLVEFATRGNAERNERENRREPWRQHAGRLLLALGEWKAELAKRGGNDPGRKYAIDMIDQATKVLGSVEAGSEAAPANLGAWLGNTQLPNKILYKGLDKAVVQPSDPNTQ